MSGESRDYHVGPAARQAIMGDQTGLHSKFPVAVIFQDLDIHEPRAMCRGLAW